MSQDFAERLIDLRCLGFASKAVAKLCLDHAERRFDVAPFVVLLEEPFLIERKIMEHAIPKIASHLIVPSSDLRLYGLESGGRTRHAIALERNVRHGFVVHYRL